MDTTLSTEIRDLFTDYLTRNGHRQTRERYAILEQVYDMKGHFDVETLYNKMLEEKSFHISRATLYNTIELLITAGLLVRHQFGTLAAQYETRASADTHFHLLCTHCGVVREIRDENIKRQITGKKIPKFTTEYYSLYIFGICSKCKYALKRKNQL
ncbi:MAG: transcriptional repressor [Parabacteroides sp.]|nr:transcriptional repressor [Parabacteroides sp.]